MEKGGSIEKAALKVRRRRRIATKKDEQETTCNSVVEYLRCDAENGRYVSSDT